MEKESLNIQNHIKPIALKDLIPKQHLETMTKFSSDLIDMNQRLTNYFRPMFEQLQEVSINLKPLADQLNQAARFYGPIISEALKGFEEFHNALDAAHKRDMVFLPPFFNEYPITEVRRLFVDSDRPAIEVYHEIFMREGNLERLRKLWSENALFAGDRMEILSDALTAHQHKKFTLSIPALLGQLEGLILEAFDIEQGQISWTVKESFPKQENSKYALNTSGSQVIQEILLSEVFNSSKRDGYCAKGIYPHRPTIQHGINTAYYKDPHASTRLIMLIDFASSDDFQNAANLFKEKRHSKP